MEARTIVPQRDPLLAVSSTIAVTQRLHHNPDTGYLASTASCPEMTRKYIYASWPFAPLVSLFRAVSVYTLACGGAKRILGGAQLGTCCPPVLSDTLAVED